jgi:hypothetical protein
MKPKMKGKYKYFMQAQYQYQINVDADDIFEATKLAIDKLKKLMLNNPDPDNQWNEERGSDLSMRIFHQYP